MPKNRRLDQTIQLLVLARDATQYGASAYHHLPQKEQFYLRGQVESCMQALASFRDDLDMGWERGTDMYY